MTMGMQVSKVDPGMPQDEAKALLVDKIDTFLQEKIMFADDVLVSHAATKVEDGDVILTYAFSEVVYELLLTAHKVKIGPFSPSWPLYLDGTLLVLHLP
jgi:translation initiation factor eIF-2B subunit delta